MGEVQKRSEDTREREENDGRVGGEESVRVEVKPKTWIPSSDDDAEEKDAQKTNKRKNEMDTVAASKRVRVLVRNRKRTRRRRRRGTDIKEMKANYLKARTRCWRKRCTRWKNAKETSPRRRRCTKRTCPGI